MNNIIKIGDTVQISETNIQGKVVGIYSVGNVEMLLINVNGMQIDKIPTSTCVKVENI